MRIHGSRLARVAVITRLRRDWWIDSPIGLFRVVFGTDRLESDSLGWGNYMKKLISYVAAIAALASPVLAKADHVDDFAWKEVTFAQLSNVTFAYSWSDLVTLGKRGSQTEFDGTLSWALKKIQPGPDPVIASGTVADAHNDRDGAGTFSFSNLSAGTYKLTFEGVWHGIPEHAHIAVRQDVSLGNVSVSPVPEPESYAMLLAGLGVLGFVAGRRKLNS